MVYPVAVLCSLEVLCESKDSSGCLMGSLRDLINFSVGFIGFIGLVKFSDCIGFCDVIDIN